MDEGEILIQFLYEFRSVTIVFSLKSTRYPLMIHDTRTSE